MSPARPQRPSNLLTLRRATSDADYYFLLNPNRVDPASGRLDPPPETIGQRVAFEGHGSPVQLDPWTGRIAAIGAYRREDGHISIDVTLEPGQSRLIAIGTGEWQRATLGLDPDSAGLHATATTANQVVIGERGQLRMRALEAGSYQTQLSDGRRVTTNVDALPRPQRPSPWHLTVEDWRPGRSAAETVTVTHERELDTLRPWPHIPGLEDVSGIGRYTTQVWLGPEWTGPDRGVLLELGPLFDSTCLTINDGHAGYVNPDDPTVDVTRLLVPGTNTIEIEVATTLRNRVRTVRPKHAHFARQPYGLVGPVRLVAYASASLST